jgi:hypothetical protein
MTAAYRLKGIGWFAVVMTVILASYLVSLRVAAEHKKLADMEARITAAQRDIRALETEFDTRANLVQLEKWNGDTLSLAAPGAAQFVPDEAALAALDPNGGGVPQVRTAALLVPTLSTAPAPTPTPIAAPAPAPATARPSTPAPVAAPASPSASVRVASVARTRPLPDDAVRAVVPTGRAAPAIARAAEAARSRVAVAKVRPQAVALLDRKLLSDTTFGDIMSGARREARH